MFRIITEKAVCPEEAAGAFGSKAAKHSTPRRYRSLDTAIERAQKRPGLHSVQDDARVVWAVVKNGKLLGKRAA